MPGTTIVEISPTEHAQRAAEVPRARHGYGLASPSLRLRAAQRSPREIAAGLFGSRPSVSRGVPAYRVGRGESGAEEEGAGEEGLRPRPGLSPARKRSGLGILKGAPRLCGWWRTRWSRATVALEVVVRRRITVSGEAMRRWLHELGGEGKRATLRAAPRAPTVITQLAA